MSRSALYCIGENKTFICCSHQQTNNSSAVWDQAYITKCYNSRCEIEMLLTPALLVHKDTAQGTLLLIITFCAWNMRAPLSKESGISSKGPWVPWAVSKLSYMLRPVQWMTMLTRLRGSQERKETRTMLMRRKRVFWLLRSPSASGLLHSGSWDSFRYILVFNNIQSYILKRQHIFL